MVKVTHASWGGFGFSLAMVDDGLATERTHLIPHAGDHELGEPIAFTDETKRRSFGGDTLPGVRYHLSRRVATAVTAPEGASLARRPVLHPNYPNPFNARTVLPFDMPASGPARLVIYDTLGRPVRTLADGAQAAGTHTVTWDGRDDDGRAVASGVYVARVTAGSLAHSRKVALAR